MPEHIYVIGSNSFSGSHFVRHALEAGYAVTGVSRSPEPNRVHLPYLDKEGRHPDRFRFLRADLNHDLDALLAAMEQDKPAYVVNFAAQGMVAESWLNPGQWLRTNTLSPILLHDRLRMHSWLKKFVQISTPEVYGSTSGSIAENTCYTPSTPYAVSKAAVDMSLTAFQRAYGFPVVFTRTANVYGPGQLLYRIIPKSIMRFLNGEVLELHGGGHSVRAFVHIRDVADATLRVMQNAVPGEIFHISAEDRVSIRDLVYRIGSLTGADMEKQIQIGGERLGKDAFYLLDDVKIRKKFGWENTISLNDGLKGVMRWVADNYNILKEEHLEYSHKE
jgi:dTDP-glucose 4,6-dehydratase